MFYKLDFVRIKMTKNKKKKGKARRPPDSNRATARLTAECSTNEGGWHNYRRCSE